MGEGHDIQTTCMLHRGYRAWRSVGLIVPLVNLIMRWVNEDTKAGFGSALIWDMAEMADKVGLGVVASCESGAVALRACKQEDWIVANTSIIPDGVSHSISSLFNEEDRILMIVAHDTRGALTVRLVRPLTSLSQGESIAVIWSGKFNLPGCSNRVVSSARFLIHPMESCHATASVSTGSDSSCKWLQEEHTLRMAKETFRRSPAS
jgi:hypothetical protein